VVLGFNYADRIAPWDDPVYAEQFGYSIESAGELGTLSVDV